ncbi:MAG TPA: hypothetical protein VF158_08125 [Longimicrobiales bacterium]
MAARSPSTASVPLHPEDPADLWDRLVADGISPDRATAMVQAATGVAPRDATAVPVPALPRSTPPTLTAAPPASAFRRIPAAPRGLAGAIGRDLDAALKVTLGNAARLLPGVEGAPTREDAGRAIRGAFTVLDPIGTGAELAVASALDFIAGVPDPERRSLLARAYEEGVFDAALRATGLEDAFGRFTQGHPGLGLAANIAGSALGGDLAEGVIRGGVRAAGRRAAREVSEEVAERAGREAGELPMDEAARLARAREQGFNVDQPVFHGTVSFDSDAEVPFREFDDSRLGAMTRDDDGSVFAGHHFALSPADASFYAERAASRSEPMMIQGDEPWDVTVLEPQPRVDSYFLRGRFKTSPGRNKAAEIAKARAAGFDGVFFPRGTDVDTPGTFVVFDPRNIRSTRARFDPKNVDRPDLLGAATPAATAALGLAGAGGLAVLSGQHQNEDQMSSNPSQATVPLPQDRERAAARWDALVAAGVDPDEATRIVARETGISPGDTTAAALARHGGPTRAAAAEAGIGQAPAPDAPDVIPITSDQPVARALRAIERVFPRVAPIRSRAQAASEGAVQSATLGFADEIEGALDPARTIEDARRALRQAREIHPGATFAGEIAGGLATGAVGATRTGAAMLARPVVGGAIEGAISGAGSAEGGLGRRLAGAAAGAALGAATGGLVRGAGALRGARGRAQGRIVRALEREGFDDPAAAVRGLRPGQTLMDVGETGGPIQRLARAAESIPSEGAERIRRTLRERAEEAPTRIKAALQREAKLTFEDAVQTADELAAKRAADAAPLYRAAYQHAVSDDVVRGLFDDPEFQRAYRLAQRTAAQEVGARQALETAGLPVPLDLQDAEVLPKLFEVDADGRVTFVTKSIPVRALDYMKSALQEVIDQDIAGGRLTKRGAMMLKRKLDAFLARVDELVPEYAQARATFAGQSRIMEAFDAARNGSAEMGLRKFLVEDPRKIERALEKLSPSEQEFYARGALDAVRERLESSADGRDLTRVIFGNSEMRRRIRSLFQSDADFNRFRQAMMRERRMAEGERFILGGSPTARIQAEQADLVSDVPVNRFLGAVESVVDPRGAARRGLRSLGARMTVRGGERTVNELAPFLTATGGRSAGAAADALTEAARQEAIRDAVVRLLTSGGAIPAGLAAGHVVGAGGGAR